MKVEEVQEQMRAGAIAALKKQMPYPVALRAFLLTMAGEALHLCGNHQTSAAAMLGMSPSYLSQLINARLKAPIGAPNQLRKAKGGWEAKHGTQTPQDVIAQMEL